MTTATRETPLANLAGRSGAPSSRTNDLSFSTTDHAGRVTAVNRVLLRRSQFARETLMHSPHNILRSPNMPQGAFRLMWESLEGGRPFCAYVENQAADGSTYRVFSTITPIDAGYLSVRQRPMCEGLREAAFEIYTQARPQEIDARASGVSAFEAATAGAGALVEGITAAGFASYEVFIWAALPAEMEQRATQITPIAQRHDAPGVFGMMLKAIVLLAEEMRGWSGRQEDLGKVVESLAQAVPDLEASIGSAEQTAGRISDVASGNTELAPILLSVTLWAAMMAEIRGLAAGLVNDLVELRAGSARTRFRIALARLHADAMGQFVNELIDESDADRLGEDAVGLLNDAVAAGIAEVIEHSQANSNHAAAVVDHLKQLSDLLAVPHGLISNWRAVIEGREHEAIKDLVPLVEAQLKETEAEIAVLESLAGQVSAICQPVDFATANELVGTIGSLSAEVCAPVQTPRRALSD